MKNNQLARQCVQIVLKVFGVLALVIAAMMILQYVNLLQFNPESSEVIPELKERLAREGDNAELQEMVRGLDLLLRRSWFVAQEQLRMGGTILFSLLGVILLGLIYLALTGEKQAAREQRSDDEKYGAVLRVIISCIGGLLCVGALFIAYKGNIHDTVAQKDGASSSEQGAEAPKEKVYASKEEWLKNWPQFRGPLQDNTLSDITLFTDWDVEEEKNIVWKLEVPLPGFSSPIKWGEQIFVSAGDDKERKVFCYEASTGKLLWEHLVTGIPGSPAEAPEVTEDTGYAASTPACDGERVFAVFATGDLVALDKEGNRIWAMNLGVPKNPYGFASSLVTTTHHLFVQYDNEEKHELYLFDSASGEVIWKKTRDVTISWSTPLIINDEVIVLATSTTMEAYDLKTGKELWMHENMAGEVAVAPIFHEGKVFMANDNATAVCLDYKSGEVLWENSDFDLPDVSTPIAFDGLLLLCTSGGVIEGIDMDTGELLWEQELEYGFYNSPLRVGKQVVIFDMEGTGYVFEASKEGYTEIEIKKLNEMVVAVPIAEENKLWIRGRDHFYHFAKKGEE